MSSLSRAPGFLLLALIVGALSVPAAAEVTAADRALLERSDLAAGLPSSFRMALTVGTIDTDRTSRIDVWGDAAGHLLVQFLDPNERGKFLLQRDDGFWFIAPGARRPVRLDRSYRLWGAASLDEIVGLSYAEDYELVDSRRIETASGEIVELELTARSPSLPYQRALYVVHAEKERPLRTELRLPSGKTARVLEFTRWAAGERLRPRELVIKDVLRGGGAIRVEIRRVEEITAPSAIFELEDDGARSALDGASTTSKSTSRSTRRTSSGATSSMFELGSRTLRVLSPGPSRSFRSGRRFFPRAPAARSDSAAKRIQ